MEDTTKLKRCYACQQTLPYSEFYYHSVRKCLSARCKKCQKAEQKQRYMKRVGYKVTITHENNTIRQFETESLPTEIKIHNKMTNTMYIIKIDLSSGQIIES